MQIYSVRWDGWKIEWCAAKELGNSNWFLACHEAAHDKILHKSNEILQNWLQVYLENGSFLPNERHPPLLQGFAVCSAAQSSDSCYRWVRQGQKRGYDNRTAARQNLLIQRKRHLLTFPVTDPFSTSQALEKSQHRKRWSEILWLYNYFFFFLSQKLRRLKQFTLVRHGQGESHWAKHTTPTHRSALYKFLVHVLAKTLSKEE